MKFFLFITLISACLLFWAKPFTQKSALKRELPAAILAQKASFKDSFEKPENANVLWAFMTGEKKGITPKTQRDFNALEIGFFFSPSGLHLSGLLFLLFLLSKKIFSKKVHFLWQILFLSLCFFLPYLAIKRIAGLRLLILSQRFFKRKVPIEIIFAVIFLISFLLGHFRESPLGFILSFLYMGTFIALRDYSKITIIIGLFSSHLIICFFSGAEISFLSLILNLPLIALFSFLIPMSYLYFFSFHWIHFNWIEFIVRTFIMLVHWSARLTLGTFVSSTFFLILAVWIILLKKQKRFLLLLLLLHGNNVHSPTFSYSGSYSVGQREFVRK